MPVFVKYMHVCSVILKQLPHIKKRIKDTPYSAPVIGIGVISVAARSHPVLP